MKNTLSSLIVMQRRCLNNSPTVLKVLSIQDSKARGGIEQKGINKHKLYKHTVFGVIFDWFWTRKSAKIGIKNDPKMRMDQKSLSRPFWRGVGVRPLESTAPLEGLGGGG